MDTMRRIDLPAEGLPVVDTLAQETGRDVDHLAELLGRCPLHWISLSTQEVISNFRDHLAHLDRIVDTALAWMPHVKVAPTYTREWMVKLASDQVASGASDLDAIVGVIKGVAS